MGWFTRLCRNTGLMIHHATMPLRKSKHQMVMNEKIEEDRVSDNITLRRTTIDEIEWKGGEEGKREAD